MMGTRLWGSLQSIEVGPSRREEVGWRKTFCHSAVGGALAPVLWHNGGGHWEG